MDESRMTENKQWLRDDAQHSSEPAGGEFPCHQVSSLQTGPTQLETADARGWRILEWDFNLSPNRESVWCRLKNRSKHSDRVR